MFDTADKSPPTFFSTYNLFLGIGDVFRNKVVFYDEKISPNCK